MAIPKIIHYVWVGDPNKKPKMFYRCLESWKKFAPDYQIIEWNENNFDFNVARYSREAYELKKYGFVADYIRVKVLEECGGFYFDTDVELVKPLDDLLNNSLLISFENGAYVETAVLGAEKGHPLAKLMADFYVNYPFKKKNGSFNATPNTPIWTYFLRKYYGLKMKNKLQSLTRIDGNDNSNVTVLPNDYFCPINYTTKEMKLTANTYAIHYFDASWFDKKLKRSEKFLRGLYKFIGKGFFTMLTRIYARNVGRKVEKHLKNQKKLTEKNKQN